MNHCTTGYMPGGFDNDSTLNESLGTFVFTPTTAYDCQTASGTIKRAPGNPARSRSTGRSSSTATSNSRRMPTRSTKGTGTIYASSAVDFKARAKLCGIAIGSPPVGFGTDDVPVSVQIWELLS